MNLMNTTHIRPLKALFSLTFIILAMVQPSSLHAQQPEVIGNPVYTAAWSPDDSKLAASYYDGSLKIIDATTNQTLFDLIDHIGRETVIDWRPDGSQIATGGYDGRVYIWNTDTGQLDTTIFDSGVADEIAALQWSEDGTRLFIVKSYQDDYLHTWNAITQELELSVDTSYLTDIAQNPNGEQIAFSFFASTIEIREADTLNLISYFGTHPDNIPALGNGNEIRHLQWSQNGQYLLSGAIFNRVVLWDVSTGNPQQVVSGTEFINWNPFYSMMRAVWFGENDCTFYSVRGDGAIHIWETASGELLGASTLANPPIYAATVSNDGTKIAYGDATGALIVDSVPLPLVAESAQEASTTLSIDWSPDDQWVATTHLDNRIRIWNATTGLVERSTQIIPSADFQDDPPGLLDIEWSPDGNRLAFLIRDRDYSIIRIVNAFTFQDELNITNNSELLDWVSDIEWNPEGTMLAGTTIRGTGSAGDYYVKVWDTSSGRRVDEIQTLTAIYQIEWNPDVDRQQLAMEGGTLAQIWNIGEDNGFVLLGHEGSINSVSWNSDGTRLATRDDITIQVWDAETGQNVNRIYQGTANSTDKVMWMPNSDHFISFGREPGYDALHTLNATGSRTSEGVRLPNRFFDLNVTGERVVVSPDSESIEIYGIASGEIIPFAVASGE